MTRQPELAQVAWRVAAAALSPQSREDAIRTFHSATERLVMGWTGAGRDQAERFIFRAGKNEPTVCNQIEGNISASSVMAAAGLALVARMWALVWCHEIAGEHDGTQTGFDRAAWAAHCRSRRLRAAEEFAMHLEEWA